MNPAVENLFEKIPGDLTDELFQTLLARDQLKIERIISHGHSTPDGQWYDQEWDEWVLLFQGTAKLLYENGEQVSLRAGDYLLIPAHVRHRVAWTDPDQYTLWLAVHFP